MVELQLNPHQDIYPHACGKPFTTTHAMSLGDFALLHHEICNVTASLLREVYDVAIERAVWRIANKFVSDKCQATIKLVSHLLKLFGHFRMKVCD